MDRLPAWLATLLAAATAFAGCAGGDAPADEPTDEDFEGLELEATESTGVIRGVAVDEAIRPVAGATVRIAGPAEAQAETTADGLFGFADLPPGTYFITVTKVGFQATQANAEVVAGVPDPPIVRVLLVADPATAPYVATYVFEGFIECSGSFVAVGFAACNAAGLPNDRFLVEYELERVPHWAQSEMSWESTQAISPSLAVMYSAAGESALLDNYAEDRGTSPLLLQVNRTLAEERGLGNGTSLMIRVFNEPIEGTRPGDPLGGDDCLDRPVLGGCATGLGLTLQQKFTVVTNVFYGFAPDPAWRFAVDGPHPPPA